LSAGTTTKRDLTIVRRLNAPRELVFQAWTDPVHLQWFANPTHPPREPITVDLRVGGAWRLQMIENAEKAYVTGGFFREIVPPEKLVFTWGAVDGWPEIDPNKLDDMPLATVTLNDLGDATEMIFHFAFPDHFSDADVEAWFALGIAAGWTETIDRLHPYLQASRR
jgi:uncharacterized protein YndB with AHSA1/START domain